MQKDLIKPVEQLTLILIAITNYFKVEPEEIFLRSRLRSIAYKRQLFFHFCNKYLESSVSDIEIGAMAVIYNCKAYDRNTVRHGTKVIKDSIQFNRVLKNQYNEIDDAVQEALGIKDEATLEILEKISQLLKYTKLTSQDLAKAYNINHNQILEYQNV